MSHDSTGSREDPHVAMLVVTAALVVAIWILAYVFDSEARVILGVMAWAVVKPFAALHDVLAGTMAGTIIVGNFVGRMLFVEPSTASAFLERVDLSTMTDEQRGLVLAIAGRCFSIFAIPAIFIMAFAARTIRPDEVYRSVHSLDSLIDMHGQNWSASRFSRQVNPLEQPSLNHKDIQAEKSKRAKLLKTKKGVSGLLAPALAPQAYPNWARAARPEEWLDINNVLWTDEECDAEAVEMAFSAQLRREWKGFDCLSWPEKALMAACVRMNAYDLKGAEGLLDDLSVLFAEAGLKLGMTKAILAEEGLPARIQSILTSPEGKRLEAVGNAHAWAETAMLGMLEECRDGKGILASPRFIWMKQHDRTMWYALNNLGGNAVMAECAGIFAHYKAEKQFGFPLAVPYVRHAALALIEDYLDQHPERVSKRKARKMANRSMADLVRAEASSIQDKKGDGDV